MLHINDSGVKSAFFFFAGTAELESRHHRNKPLKNAGSVLGIALDPLKMDVAQLDVHIIDNVVHPQHDVFS